MGVAFGLGLEGRGVDLDQLAGPRVVDPRHELRLVERVRATLPVRTQVAPPPVQGQLAARTLESQHVDRAGTPQREEGKAVKSESRALQRALGKKLRRK